MAIIEKWDIVRWPRFKPDEFTCRCGCGSNEMDAQFIDKLQSIRNEINYPMLVTSGYRCPDYNQEVSSTGPHGPHTTGKACDIAIAGNYTYRLLFAAFKAGMTGIGIKQKGSIASRFIHLDTLVTPPRPNIWSY